MHSEAREAVRFPLRWILCASPLGCHARANWPLALGSESQRQFSPGPDLLEEMFVKGGRPLFLNRQYVNRFDHELDRIANL